MTLNCAPTHLPVPVVPQVVAIAGTAFYTAAATATGLLHIWRPGGNTLLPPLVLGCPPVSLAAHGDWQLQVVGADGDFYLLDFSSVSRHNAISSLGFWYVMQVTNRLPWVCQQ